MKHFITLLLVLSGLTASAQPLLKRPLQFVPADSVFILPRGEHNVIMDIMAVAPFAEPKPIVVTKADRKRAKRATLDRQLPLQEQLYESARMLLLTGQASYAELLDDSYFRIFADVIADDEGYTMADRERAGQHLLNLTGTIIATDYRRDVFINLFENCATRVHTSKFRMLLDMISEYPEGPMVKLRIDGLDQSNTPFALHIRVPKKGAPRAYYINGHEIIRPVIENGYLVIDRKWRNGEEVYFLLNE